MKKIALATVAVAFCLANLPSMAAPAAPKSTATTAGKPAPKQIGCGLMLPWCPKY